MIAAGVMEAFIGVKAERAPLEEVASPLARVGRAEEPDGR